MFLYEKVSFDDFLEAFKRMGRENQFSYEAKRAIYDYLWDFAESTHEPVEFDVIRICCEFAEYVSIEELLNECLPDYVAEWAQGKLTVEDVRKVLEQLTDVVSFDVDAQGRGSIVVLQFSN